MGKTANNIRIVDGSEYPDYPISAKDRLDSHYFLAWNLKRWRGSEFRKKADPEVGWFGFQLFCIAQDGTPIGTLPCDEQQLAFDLNLPLEKWQALLDRAIHPRHGWYKVQCDNGEVRWAHEVVTEVALEALAGSHKNAANKSKGRERKRLGDLKDSLERNGFTHLTKNPGYVERLDAWLIEHRSDRNRTESVMRQGMDAIALRDI